MDRGNGSTDESAKLIAGGKDVHDESAEEISKVELVVERKKNETATPQTQSPNPTAFPEQDQSALLRRPHEILDFSSQPAPKNTTLDLPTSTADESNPLDPCGEFRPLPVDTVVPTQEMSSLEEVLPQPQDQQSFLQMNVEFAANTAGVYVEAAVHAEADDEADDDDAEVDVYTTSPMQATDDCLPDVSPGSESAHQSHVIVGTPLVTLPQVLVSSLSPLSTASGTFVLVDAEDGVDAEAVVSTTTPVQATDHCLPDFPPGSASAHQNHMMVCIPMVTLPQVLICSNQTVFPPYQRSSLSPLCTASGTFVPVLVQDETSAATANTTQSAGGNGSENNLLPPLYTTSGTCLHSALQDPTANATDSTESNDGNDGENNSLPPLHTTSSTSSHSVLQDLSTANVADSTESDDENDSENSSTDKCTSQYANAKVNENHLDDDEPSIGSLGDFEEQADSSEEASSEEEAADSRTQFSRKKNRKKHKTRRRS